MPKGGDLDLDDYIRVHLAHELRYLLVAATTWKRVFPKRERHRYVRHLGEMAQSSVFVHSRVLYEFFGCEEGWDDLAPHSPIKSKLWNTYKGLVHMKVLHPDPRRPYEANKQLGDELPHIVDRFAIDVLKLWDEVARQASMEGFRETMLEARRAAVDDAARSAAKMGMPPLFT